MKTFLQSKFNLGVLAKRLVYASAPAPSEGSERASVTPKTAIDFDEDTYERKYNETKRVLGDIQNGKKIEAGTQQMRDLLKSKAQMAIEKLDALKDPQSIRAEREDYRKKSITEGLAAIRKIMQEYYSGAPVKADKAAELVASADDQPYAPETFEINANAPIGHAIGRVFDKLKTLSYVKVDELTYLIKKQISNISEIDFSKIPAGTSWDIASDQISPNKGLSFKVTFNGDKNFGVDLVEATKEVRNANPAIAQYLDNQKEKVAKVENT
ncbi:MAG: hypothetical protein WC843_04925 [Candidatus Gracilibacteria bacterium]|jgi:hypothetical protein